jgi:hypothetical protein
MGAMRCNHLLGFCVVFVAAACSSSPSSNDDGGPSPEAGRDSAAQDSGQSSLPTNCIDPNNASKPQCVGDDPSAGTLGTGPSFAEGQVYFAGGYVSGSTLVVTGGDATTGFVMTIDLTTGNRTLLSGQLDDPKQGNITVGTGPAFAFPSTVAKDGADYVVLDSDIYKVDGTGTRTLLSNLSTLKCTVSAGTEVGADDLSPSAGVGVGSDGSLYMPATDGNSYGALTKISATGATCTVVSYSGDPTDKVAAIGTGPSFDTLFSGVLVSNVLYGGDFAQESIIGVNITTGVRTNISDWGTNGVGTGDNGGSDSVAPGSGNWLWTWGAPPAFTDTVVKVDIATGNRTGFLAATGPLSNVNLAGVEVYGEWNGNVVLGMFQSIYLLDPASLDTNRISH